MKVLFSIVSAIYDWDTDYLFIEALKLYDDNTDFKLFIEVMLDPRYYPAEEML